MSGITTAIDTFNADFTGVVQWVNNLTCNPDGDGQCSDTYVDIYLDPSLNTAAGDVNTIGYPPSYDLPAVFDLNCAGGSTNPCATGTLLHEMGHIIGLYHEFTRSDRDSYVTVDYDNVIKGTWTADFAINTQNQQLLSPYDYASVMQYPPYVDTRNGGPVIESIPPGIPMSGAEGVPGAGNQDYSAGDKEGIMRLYGHAPTAVTITSNPVGLQVVVDGTTYTTPVPSSVTSGWTLGSTHTLSVADGVQTLTGNIEGTTAYPNTTFYYTYGRWSDSTQQSHSITIAAGDGSPSYPATSPAVATYSANFIQLVPYTTSVYPTGSGTVSISPAPQTYTVDSVMGQYFVARQEETFTATPNSGYNFYEFNNGPYWLYGGLGANPKEFYVPDSGDPVDTTVEFSNTPVYTVNVVPSGAINNAFASNLEAIVDGTYWPTPKNFSSLYDGTDWDPGNVTNTLNIDSTQQPLSLNTEFNFTSWSDGGAQSHSITLPGTNTTYTATVEPLFYPATNFGYPPCGGTATVTPASTNGGFYPWGTELTYTPTPGTGWNFAGWTFDLTGTASPASLTAKDETLVYANFNIEDTTTPVTITSLSPGSVAAGTSTFTLNIYGTGFSPYSYVVAYNSEPYGNYPTVTYVSSTELQVQIPGSYVTSPGTFDIAIENYPNYVDGYNGCAVFAYDTFAVTASGTGSITPTIGWTPAAEIVYGDPGAGVLNATTTPPDIGPFTYSATPTGGGSAVGITAGTSGLATGKYTATATVNPTNPQFASTNASNSLTVAGETVWIVDSTDGGLSELTGDGYAIISGAYSGAERVRYRQRRERMDDRDRLCTA